MARRATLRASDSDRDRIAELLRAAAAEGRLLTEELEERLSRAFRARTYGELDVLVADLPRERVPGRRRRRFAVGRIGVVPAVALVLLLPLAMAVVVAIVTLVFAMLTAWAAVAAIVWLMVGHRTRWYGPRARHYARLPMRPRGMYGPRRAHSRSGPRL